MDADQISGLAQEGISLIQARRVGWQLLVSTDSLVLCNWYGWPFLTPPCGPQFFERISASLARPVSPRIQALRSLLEIRSNSLRRLASHTGYTTLRHTESYRMCRSQWERIRTSNKKNSADTKLL